MTKSSFTNAAVVITGAGSGMGRELALQAAARGAAIFASDINPSSLEETKRIGQTKGLNLQTEVLDVANKNAINDYASTLVPQLNNRRLVLINNAGVALMSGPLQDTNLDDFEWLLNINLWGAIRLTKAFYPYFFARNDGHIVNISSVFGLVGVENNSAYCTAKFALRGFTETLRMELKGTNILTTVVHPGGIKTNIVRNARLGSGTVSSAMHQQSVGLFDKQARTTAESAAKQILDAIEKKKQRLVIGRDGFLLDTLARLMPVGYTGVIRRQMEKTFGAHT